MKLKVRVKGHLEQHILFIWKIRFFNAFTNVVREINIEKYSQIALLQKNETKFCNQKKQDIIMKLLFSLEYFPQQLFVRLGWAWT